MPVFSIAGYSKDSQGSLYNITHLMPQRLGVSKAEYCCADISNYVEDGNSDEFPAWVYYLASDLPATLMESPKLGGAFANLFAYLGCDRSGCDVQLALYK